MTARRTAWVFVFGCVLLLTQAAASADAAPPVSGWAAAAPGSIFTLAGDPLIEGVATTFGQSFSELAVSGQTLYIADSEADVIRAVDMPTDAESVVAGTSAEGFAGDGEPASDAELDNPNGLAIDQEGDLLVADSGNRRVRLIAAADCGSDCPYGLESMTRGDIYTIAGVGRDTSFSEGPAGESGVGEPGALAIDSHGDLMISEEDLVLMVADYSCAEECPYGLASMVKGDIYHVAGQMYHNEFTGGNQPATSTGIAPEGLAVDSEGNLLIADADNNGLALVLATADCTADCP
jgi:hypothetical protein